MERQFLRVLRHLPLPGRKDRRTTFLCRQGRGQGRDGQRSVRNHLGIRNLSYVSVLLGGSVVDFSFEEVSTTETLITRTLRLVS